MKLLVIDGNSILNRAFYGIRLLTNKKGVYTNAITGFFNIFLKLKANFAPDSIAVAFDLKAPTFRHKLYDGYKANRKGMPEELAMQLPYVKEILTAMGVPMVTLEGYEADDLIGTLSHAADLAGAECVIATGDRDSFQLITDKVSVNLAGNKEDVFYTPEKIREVYGVEPKQMIEVKALMGDTSDNIPGVKGIGEKTALNLIQNYNTVSNIYDNIDNLTISDSVRKKLAEGKETAFLSRDLGTICLEAPIDTNPDSYKTTCGDQKRLAEILTELEMFTLLKKMNISKSELDAAKEQLAAKERLEKAETVDVQLDPRQDDLILYGGQLVVCKNKTASILLPLEEKEYLESDTPKRTFSVKELWSYALERGYSVNNVVFDSTLAAYLLNVNANEYSLERLCGQYNVPLPESYEQLGECLFALNTQLFRQLTKENMTNLLTEIEIPLAEVLSNMERDGVMLDSTGLELFGEGLLEDAKRLEQEIYDLAGEKFNIGSPKQLGVILFEKLQLPYGKKTKTGYSTNADVLESLADKHPIINKISEYRALTKLHSTYVTGLLKAVCPDGRIHSTFKQTETRTGRISSVEPNIQNIPVRTELGKNMRKFFVAKRGYKLVDADYSQIELRVLAHISDDKIMQEAFASGDDIHAITASQVFNQPLQWVTPQMRSSAKAVNFGIVYGIGAFSLSKDIGVSVAEAKRYIEAYLEKYSGVDRYMKQTVEDAKEKGYVSTMMGRKRFIPEINASNKIAAAAAARIAMNTPIQGTAADIIKLAMIKVFRRLKQENINARLILQVHDELIVEAEEGCADRAAELLKEEMENCVKLAVPLIVDAETGNSWYETH